MLESLEYPVRSNSEEEEEEEEIKEDSDEVDTLDLDFRKQSILCRIALKRFGALLVSLAQISFQVMDRSRCTLSNLLGWLSWLIGRLSSMVSIELSVFEEVMLFIGCLNCVRRVLIWLI
jgi:hypothetical protein